MGLLEEDYNFILKLKSNQAFKKNFKPSKAAKNTHRIFYRSANNFLKSSDTFPLRKRI